MQLVIVESPTKAKTISKFLTSGFRVESSFGHVRDLPEKKMGIDTENDFMPEYVVSPKAKKHVALLKKQAANCEKILFATDEDREGEAIAWHLKYLLKPKKHERITFHEITAKAIAEALKHPRDIDLNLVDAQQARRVLDRLVGYELSPFLWKKVAKGLSAGRVQSVTVRLIVEREREIENFKAQEYWTIEAEFEDEKKTRLAAKLHSIDSKTLDKFAVTDEISAKNLKEKLQNKKYIVLSVEAKEIFKKPPEPFRTSTLQQAANNRLHFSSKQTMKFAQELYEGVELGGHGQIGLITYMRTDSLNLSEEFLSGCRDYITEKIGKNYSAPRRFKTKSKNAQEAHEAIRPTHVNFAPDEIKQYLSERQYKLYRLIWTRSVASQMAEAKLNAAAINIANEDGNNYIFRSQGQTIIFDGFLKIYPADIKENILPAVKQNQPMALAKIEPIQHFTEPPARYTEASLVKALEEYGIGRPSTYAPTIATIQERKYVVKEQRQLRPTDMGEIVNDILVEHFPQIVDYKFTAEMEESLDAISRGEKKWPPVIKAFYGPFKSNLEKKLKTLTKKELTEEKTEERCEKCGAEMVIKTGRYGRFLACSAFPTCRNAKPLNGENAGQLELTDEKCPECGANLARRRSRYGQFLGCSNYPKCKYIKKNEQTETGVACPQCGNGKLVAKRGKSRKIFYACDQYPQCKFILWGKPTGEHCPLCQSLMIEKAGKTVCSNAECAKQLKT